MVILSGGGGNLRVYFVELDWGNWEYYKEL